MKFFVYLFIVLIFACLLLVWKKIYFKPLCVIRVEPGFSQLVSVRPSSSWFRMNRSSRSCFVSLGAGYVAYQCSDAGCSQKYSDLFVFDDTVYVFRVRLGRLCSVDLSDRCLHDVLKKFFKG